MQLVDKDIIPFSALSFVLSSVLLRTLMANSSASFKVGGSLYSCFSMETAACVHGKGVGEKGQKEREREGGGTTKINFMNETHQLAPYLPGGCYRCRWLSILRSYRLGHSGRVGNHGEDPIPCRGWTHQRDASLDEEEERSRRKRGGGRRREEE